MTEADRREGIIAPKQIAGAADALFQIEKGYIHPELINEKGLTATLTLRAAGRDAVRAVCGSALESLDAKFWASDEEIKNARRLIAHYVKGGWIEVTVFQNFGLDTHIPYLARDQYGVFPQLNEGARSRLFLYSSDLVLRELSALHENIYVALNKLNPEDVSQPLKTAS